KLKDEMNSKLILTDSDSMKINLEDEKKSKPMITELENKGNSPSVKGNEIDTKFKKTALHHLTESDEDDDESNNKSNRNNDDDKIDDNENGEEDYMFIFKFSRNNEDHLHSAKELLVQYLVDNQIEVYDDEIRVQRPRSDSFAEAFPH